MIDNLATFQELIDSTIFPHGLPLENQFKGNITTSQAAEGIEVALKNANELLLDATLLFDNKRYPRSISLAIFAIEEVGKVERIKDLLLSKQNVQQLWKKLRNHKSKNFLWQFPHFKAMKINDPKIIRAIISPDGDSAKFLDQLKQICFYTEAITGENKSCVWWLPSDITDKEVAKFYLDTADKVVLDDGITWSTEALEIFKEYAVYEDDEVKYPNLLAYYKTLCKKGHITKDRLDKIIKNIKRR